MNLTDEERLQCNDCLKKLYQTKLSCIQSIQYLIEQQREIDECITDLKSTKIHAQEINEKISELNQISWLKLCCSKKKTHSLEINLHDDNHLLILPFLNVQSNLNNCISGLNEIEKDFELEKLFNSIKTSYTYFSTKDEFEKILHEEYTLLFELAKKLTKCIQILHDTIEFLGTDIKLTLEHMQLAQPRMRQLLQIKAPLAFAQVQKDFMT
ncbi:unnamed protein product [Adineta steineri]|uniref:Uncharacterized protein n=1 Tax=Adineta steineri TaxID=433720 RepID=A0A813Y0L7_9BILA|nr:unnamed protein product [Adineta steineri]CAF4153038.1 unnamed protein product [Adineta steineri]